jgi:hypothetical protein
MRRCCWLIDGREQLGTIYTNQFGMPLAYFLPFGEAGYFNVGAIAVKPLGSTMLPEPLGSDTGNGIKSSPQGLSDIFQMTLGRKG